MIVLTERGFGVLEMKHSYGRIEIGPDGLWRAGPAIIKAGRHTRNPREQVRQYASILRRKVLNLMMPPYLTDQPSQWDRLKFQTGVCFTNPKADLSIIKEQLSQKRPEMAPWETSFSVFGLEGFTPWVRQLRFELEDDPSMTKDYEPVRLSPDRILQIARDALGGVEWTELYQAMPESRPYGFLILRKGDREQIFSLNRDNLVIGRRLDCDIVISQDYTQVSKNHCRIVRGLTTITLHDESKNGTYLGGKKIKTMELSHGDTVTLGGQQGKPFTCSLQFLIREKASHLIKTAEAGTQTLPKSFSGSQNT
jgi:pSer/pThr/pTyr-binding forkhead associated (FHA) protein